MSYFVDGLATRAVHWVARAALRLQQPLRAKATVDWLARLTPPLRDVDHATRANRALQGAGSCLSRAVAVASRLRGGDVVIGVDPLQPARLAHAWVEIDGVPVGPRDGLRTNYAVIARLPSRNPRAGSVVTLRPAGGINENLA